MIRIVIENLLLFLLPTLIYVGYRLLVGPRGNGTLGVLDGVPFVWLFAAGAVTVAAFVVYFSSLDGGRPGEAYYPPVQRDGQIIQEGAPGPSATVTAPAASPAPAGK